MIEQENAIDTPLEEEKRHFLTRTVKLEIIVAALGASFLAGLFIIAFSWKAAEAEIEQVGQFDNVTATTSDNQFGSDSLYTSSTLREKTPQQVVKGLYLTAYSAGSTKKLNEIISLIDKTELNAVVMDIKDYSGLVLYNSKIPAVVNLHLKNNRYPDLAATIKKLHDHHIYVIARQTVFQDPVLAAAKPAWSIKSKLGGVWHDNKGLTWVDPTKKEVWDYNIAIAKEAISYGFDEINFDYVRFPSDGNMKNVVYSVTSSKKYLTMQKFYNYLSLNLNNQPAWISFDMFGFVMDKKGEDDMNIGQRLADAVDNADYVCPMMYPSHYPAGYLGLKNPAANPQQVIDHGLTVGEPKFVDKKAQLRPWIQDFNIGAVYDAGMIRTEIDTVEKHNTAGWLLWNAANRYTTAGLKMQTNF